MFLCSSREHVTPPIIRVLNEIQWIHLFIVTKDYVEIKNFRSEKMEVCQNTAINNNRKFRFLTIDGDNSLIIENLIINILPKKSLWHIYLSLLYVPTYLEFEWKTFLRSCLGCWQSWWWESNLNLYRGVVEGSHCCWNIQMWQKNCRLWFV